MIEISEDELRDDLRKYLQLVEQGDVLVITRAGKSIAKILPVKADPSEDVKPAIIKHGRNPLSPWKPTAVNRGPGLISDLVNQERKEGY